MWWPTSSDGPLRRGTSFLRPGAQGGSMATFRPLKLEHKSAEDYYQQHRTWTCKNLQHFVQLQSWHCAEQSGFEARRIHALGEVLQHVGVARGESHHHQRASTRTIHVHIVGKVEITWILLLKKYVWISKFQNFGDWVVHLAHLTKKNKYDCALLV